MRVAFQFAPLSWPHPIPHPLPILAFTPIQTPTALSHTLAASTPQVARERQHERQQALESERRRITEFNEWQQRGEQRGAYNEVQRMMDTLQREGQAVPEADAQVRPPGRRAAAMAAAAAAAEPLEGVISDGGSHGGSMDSGSDDLPALQQQEQQTWSPSLAASQRGMQPPAGATTTPQRGLRRGAAAATAVAATATGATLLAGAAGAVPGQRSPASLSIGSGSARALRGAAAAPAALASSLARVLADARAAQQPLRLQACMPNIDQLVMLPNRLEGLNIVVTGFSEDQRAELLAMRTQWVFSQGAQLLDVMPPIQQPTHAPSPASSSQDKGGASQQGASTKHTVLLIPSGRTNAPHSLRAGGVHAGTHLLSPLLVFEEGPGAGFLLSCQLHRRLVKQQLYDQLLYRRGGWL